MTHYEEIVDGQNHYKMNFVDQTGEQSFRIPQCGCGTLAVKHYEFFTKQDEMSDEAFVAYVVCETCLETFLNRNEHQAGIVTSLAPQQANADSNNPTDIWVCTTRLRLLVDEFGSARIQQLWVKHTTNEPQQDEWRNIPVVEFDKET